MFRGQLLEQLLRYLLYLTKTPGDFFNLAQCCRAAARIAKEYAPMKKNEFAQLNTIQNVPTLPNGLLHGWTRGVNSTLFQTGVPVFLCLSSGERTVLERKEEYHAAQGRMRFIIMPFSVFIVNYVKVWHIHLHKCALCDRFHFVEFWYGRGPARKYVFFRASCLDKKCQLRFDKVCHGIMSSCYDKVCRQRRIARKVIDYIKNHPRYCLSPESK